MNGKDYLMKSQKSNLLNVKSLYSIALVAIFFISSCSPSTPADEVSQLFFRNITHFEHQSAYDFLSKRLKEKLLAQNIKRETFFGYLQAPIGNPLWIGLQFELKEKISKGDKATMIHFKLKDTQSQQTIDGECELIIEDGLWQVDRLQFDSKQPLL
jgi:hypothetical protein